MSRRILDPRRPTGPPTNEEKEEMLIPYQPALPLNPREMPSHLQDLVGVDRIKTAPAFLESTSLVLAYGLDIFFTRRTPSKAFDILSEDFSRLSLMATTLALVVGIVVARKFADSKKVKDAFRQ